ncbi:MAG: UvrD-helicase domain-containing protein [Candidatus Woesearchaeota archaeon]
MTQEDLINCNAKRIRCIAGPGTGKTWCIQQRVKSLLKNDPTIGSKIFAVTFTRQAAAQLKQDLCNMELEGADSIIASTLHSYAFSILNKESAIQSIGRNPRPCFGFEQFCFLHDMKLKFGNVKLVREKLSAFESMWARLQNETPGWPQDISDKSFNSEYLKWMKFHKCMTVGELIALAVKYLKNNPVNDSTNSFDKIIVDEYQDLNKADQTLIDLLSSESEVMIVGDDDQSIYSFRYAHPEGIREWYDSQQSTPKEDYSLNICRRCDGKIVSLANSLISNNPNRIRGEMSPMPEKNDIGDIEIIQWGTRYKETQGIAQGIKQILDNKNLPKGEEILILVPRRDFGEFIKNNLQKIGINDVQLETKINWKNNNLGEKITLCNLKENIDDLVALRYWLGYGSSDLRTNSYSKLMNYCIEKGTLIKDVLNNNELCKELKINTLKNRWNLLQEELKKIQDLSNKDLIEALFPKHEDTLAIATMLEKVTKKNDVEKLSLQKLLIDFVLSNPEESETNNRIKIMTYHGAKGLTSHTVIVVGLVNGLLPKNPIPTSENERRVLEEERRLMYVSLTRAKKRLILSSFRKVSRTENAQLKLGLTGFSQWLTTHASSFFDELGENRPDPIDGDNWLKKTNL